MYNKNDKKRLYWLIDQYLSSEIDETEFCDEFYYSYNLEINEESLNKFEQECFLELSKVADRFSQYNEDHVLDSYAFATVKELRGKILETKNKLMINMQID
ncbi:MAG: magnesium and cobalt transport protein CorA [Candidatus Kapabacteria bacterium]|nr:magnesium and cobalt transport protein CorA [Candidatus Kapabacteria bacterium]